MVKKAKESKLNAVDDRSIRLAHADGVKRTETLLAEIHSDSSKSFGQAVSSGLYKLSAHDAIERGGIVLGMSIAKAIHENGNTFTNIEPVLSQLQDLVESEVLSFFDEYKAEHHYVKSKESWGIKWPKWDSK